MTRPNTICEEAEVRGPITFGENNIIHPKCHIVSEGGGPIIIGSNNIIEENVTIRNWTAEPVEIGDDNVFEVGCFFEGSRVGNGCVIEMKANVTDGTCLGDNCVIGTKCATQQNEQVPSDTVIFGQGHSRRIQTKSTRSQATLHARHLEYLREVLPKYHHMKVLKQ